MTPPIDAAERLRRLNNGDGIRDVYQCDHYRGVASEFLKDQWEVIDAHLRETDPTLITEEFARSVSARVTQGGRYFTGRDVANSFSIRFAGSGVYLRIDGCSKIFLNPTIGHFYTACRMFGVMLKD